jgi:uncharacterized protein YfdQ (DUF2303 family)
MTTTTDMGAVVAAAQAAVNPHPLDLGRVYAVPTGNGDIRTIDLTGDEHREMPRRKRGTTVVWDADSFLAYYRKHATSDSEVYANRNDLSITAVLDAHGAEPHEPDWCQHRLKLQLRHSDAFTAWHNINNRLVSQIAFAEFIEDNRATITTPAAADVLELAQTFHATKQVNFKSQSILKSGQRQLAYVEQLDATAGQRGEMTIPDHLVLALPVFDGATEADQVTARLRFRIDSDGKLGLGVILDQLTDVIAGAFQAVVEEVDRNINEPVMRGTPA